MGIKQKLAMGIATGALAVSMIGGGTYAYFSDTETSVNEFKAGTLNLLLSPTEIINVENIKPRDTFTKKFTLKNDGSLDIAKVLLDTSYTVTDKKGDNWLDFGEHIRVNFMWNVNNFENPIWQTTLAELNAMDPDVVADKYYIPFFGDKSGLKPNEINTLYVQFEFVDNGDSNQNQFQGDELKLTWNFEAMQGLGVHK